MITLFGANDAVRLVTSSAANIDVVASYATKDADSVDQGTARAKISSASTTTIVSAPNSGEERKVYALSFRNTHASLANTITVQVYDGTNSYELFKITLAAGETAHWDGLNGWQYFNAQGLPKLSQSQGSSAAVVGVTNVVVLASDVINNNAVANSIADVTGLSFPVVSGGKYWFEFYIDYTAAATTTGSRWTINGPAFSRLAYTSDYGLTATTRTLNSLVAYDQPAASNASSAVTTGNIAWMAGFVTPSADGNVIARFASEVASSAITAKAGSVLRWMQVA